MHLVDSSPSARAFSARDSNRQIARDILQTLNPGAEFGAIKPQITSEHKWER